MMNRRELVSNALAAVMVSALPLSAAVASVGPSPTVVPSQEVHDERICYVLKETWAAIAHGREITNITAYSMTMYAREKFGLRLETVLNNRPEVNGRAVVRVDYNGQRYVMQVFSGHSYVIYRLQAPDNNNFRALKLLSYRGINEKELDI